jgi:hypothetical protein
VPRLVSRIARPALRDNALICVVPFRLVSGELLILAGSGENESVLDERACGWILHSPSIPQADRLGR